MSPPCTPVAATVSRQGGQALLESLVALLGLAVLWVALNWLAHYQDAALSAIHASRHAAFVASRGQHQDAGNALTPVFFAGRAHRWTDRRGHSILPSDRSVKLSWTRLPPLSPRGQPGGSMAHATTLRRDWSLEDVGVLQARLHVDFGRVENRRSDRDASLLKLRAFEQAYPPLTRHISILTGAGHAASDGEAQSIVAASSLAWTAAYTASRAAGAEINLRATGVEAGWGRPAASFDWLQPWSGRVPAHLITEYDTNGRE